MIILEGDLVVKGQINSGKTINAISAAIGLADSQIRVGEKIAPKVHVFSNEIQEDFLREKVDIARKRLSAGSGIQVTVSAPSATDDDPFLTLLNRVANGGFDILVIDEPECWGDQDVYEGSIEILSEHVDVIISTRRSKDKL